MAWHGMVMCNMSKFNALLLLFSSQHENIIKKNKMNKALGEIIRFSFGNDRLPFQSSIPMKDDNGMEWNWVDWEREHILSISPNSDTVLIVSNHSAPKQVRFDQAVGERSLYYSFSLFVHGTVRKVLESKGNVLSYYSISFHLWAGLRRVRWCMPSHFSFFSAFPISIEILIDRVFHSKIAQYKADRNHCFAIAYSTDVQDTISRSRRLIHRLLYKINNSNITDEKWKKKKKGKKSKVPFLFPSEQNPTCSSGTISTPCSFTTLFL